MTWDLQDKAYHSLPQRTAFSVERRLWAVCWCAFWLSRVSGTVNDLGRALEGGRWKAYRSPADSARDGRILEVDTLSHYGDFVSKATTVSGCFQETKRQGPWPWLKRGRSTRDAWSGGVISSFTGRP